MRSKGSTLILDQQRDDALAALVEGSGRPAAFSRRQPARILHVVPSLERGGIETWLMHMLRRTDPARHAVDFLVLYRTAGAFAPEAQSLGCHVSTSPEPQNLWQLWRGFAAMLRAHGPYEIVHSHVHHFSGLIMRMGAWHGVPVRIAHSHNDTRLVERYASWRRRLYLRLMKRWVQRFATDRIAVSRSAAEDLFGPDWTSDRRCRIIPCGIDLTAFAGADCRPAVRQALGLPKDALVIGHVGRFQERKNHRFLLEIATEAFARDATARLLLVGDGELKPVIEARAAELRISDRIVFTGARADVAALMQAMDVFVLPSYYEGLGLVLLEAQALGIPCVLSDRLPEEADVVPGLMHRLPLTAPAATWIKVIFKAVASPRPSADQACRVLSQSEFTIERSVDSMFRVYGAALGAITANEGGNSGA